VSPCFALSTVGSESSILTSVTEDQYLEIISDPVAWAIVNDEGDGEDLLPEKDFKTTNSARRIRALVEQVTGRFPLPQRGQQL
jgi:RAD50-interacting protein 1